MSESSATESIPKKKRVLCCYGIDIDAVCGWLGSYGGEDSANDISRGCWAGEIGVQRLLKLLSKYDIKATWFIPGHSLETFPESCTKIRDQGHEFGLHGYSHENPNDMSLEQQRDVLDKSYRLITEFCNGKPPKGSVTPWWETSIDSVKMLLDYGIEYDHSMSHNDYLPYWLRVGDTWTKINYDDSAESWMKPLVRGKEIGLVEIAANWDLDDLPPFLFTKNNPAGQGWRDAREIEAIWKDYFDYFYREYEEFIFPITIHPDASGKPHVILMHERLIEYINSHEGVEWVTMGEISDDFKSRNPPPEGALLPKSKEEVFEALGLNY